ncbi:LPXTG cell wall anchor domain-containing protein, partial [Gemella bergeri]
DEEDVAGYTKEINGYNLTNKLLPPPPTPPLPKTGLTDSGLGNLGIALLAAALFIVGRKKYLR